MEHNINLKGIQSLTSNKEFAIKNALSNPNALLKPVLFQIFWKGTKFHFRMSDKYTVYPDEKEYLV